MECVCSYLHFANGRDAELHAKVRQRAPHVPVEQPEHGATLDRQLITVAHTEFPEIGSDDAAR